MQKMMLGKGFSAGGPRCAVVADLTFDAVALWAGWRRGVRQAGEGSHRDGG